MIYWLTYNLEFVVKPKEWPLASAAMFENKINTPHGKKERPFENYYIIQP